MNIDWYSMKVRIILQSRLSSSRLPAKALLPIAGYPCVALSALRAGNLNHEVIVATSTHSSDDLIVSTLKQFEIKCVRGSLDDVLLRFIQAVEDLAENDLIVRLTADNVFPDGAFINDIISQYSSKKADYLVVESKECQLPYGMSAEIFSVGLLRQAHGHATVSFDREHVTPWIDRHARNKVFYTTASSSPLFLKLRCTIDTLYDYCVVDKCFEKVIDPIREDSISLCERLSHIQSKKVQHDCYCTLGTAQLGMEYGIANKIGMLNENEAINIISQAIDEGVTTFDTAPAYGKAEERMGKALTGIYRDRATVITKLHVSLQSQKPNSEEIMNAVDASVFRSCVKLKMNILDTVLLHDPVQRFQYDGKIWQRLIQLKHDGFIKKLGISVYSLEDAILGLQDPHIQHIQLPLNVLDPRWKESQLEASLVKRPDVEIFVRSALLQGVLTLAPEKWPKISSDKSHQIVAALDEFVRQFNRESITDLCFAYLRSIPWISSIVIGVDSVMQWNENRELFNKPLLTSQQMQAIEEQFCGLPEDFLNPAKWNIK